MKRVRVTLVAHGEAEGPGWLENVRVSRRTLAHAGAVMRLPAPLRMAICVAGATRKRLKGGPGSTHNENTRRQAAALEEALAGDEGRRYRVDAVFASAPPYLEDELESPGDADRQLALSMIPTDSRLSCGLICRSLLEAASSTRERTTVIARFWEAAELVGIHCAHVAAHFPSIEPDRACCLILVLHGTVIRDASGHEPAFHTGVDEKKSYSDALGTALTEMPDRPWQRVEIAYLNHGVGGEWSTPTLPALLDSLAAEGVQTAVAYACEHLVDGGETLGLPDVLAAGPVPETHCLPCVNDSAEFIEFLAARVRAAASAPGTDRCCDPCPLRSGPGRGTVCRPETQRP